MVTSLARIALGGLLLVAGGLSGAAAQPAAPPTAQGPLLITSVGQSPDAYLIKVVSDRIKLAHTYDPLAPPGKLEGMKTAILAVGASLKGFGAGGVNLESELARGRELAARAKAAKVHLIVAHVGGEGRREGMSNKLLDAIADQADHLIVWKDGNTDGYFTKLAQQKKIPLTLIDQVPQIADVLKRVFGV
jgi:hypothetical protein